MAYVIPAIVVVVLVGGFVTFMVLNATRKSDAVAEADDAPGMGSDETPLGDTTQHAGEQTEHGTTAGPHDASDTPAAPPRPADPDASAHVARPGEGEGVEQLEFEGKQPAGGGMPSPPAAERAEATEEPPAEQPEASPPASERLADRGV